MRLDEDRYQRLAAAAAERGVSMATVVREAIDRWTIGSAERRREAVRRILDTPGIEPPDPTGLKAELDEVRGGRG